MLLLLSSSSLSSSLSSKSSVLFRGTAARRATIFTTTTGGLTASGSTQGSNHDTPRRLGRHGVSSSSVIAIAAGTATTTAAGSAYYYFHQHADSYSEGTRTNRIMTTMMMSTPMMKNMMSTAATTTTSTLMEGNDEYIKVDSMTESKKEKKKTKILIIGGGTAGIGVAAQLRRSGGLGKNKNLLDDDNDITILEPKDVHYYQPLWTLVGGGVKKSNTLSSKPMKDVIPNGVTWIQKAATNIDPINNIVTIKEKDVNDNDTGNDISSISEIEYEYLVIATGLETSFNHIDGLQETIGKNGVISIYDYDLCQNTQHTIQNTVEDIIATSATATTDSDDNTTTTSITQHNFIFTQHSDSPIKCGGAPQKIMWLTEDYIRNMKMSDNNNKKNRNSTNAIINVKFVLPQPSMFPVKKYGDYLNQLANERNIERHHGYRLIKVDGKTKQAVFQNINDPESNPIIMDFTILHVIPYMTPPKVLRENNTNNNNNSKLTNVDGYVTVNQDTLQHREYTNIFALGDCSTLPTSKTMAAIAKQVPVLVHNLISTMNMDSDSKKKNADSTTTAKPELTGIYDGYTSCPIPISRDKLLLAEFKYDGVVSETFPSWIQNGKPNQFFMFLKETVFPKIYFDLYLKGYWYGPNLIFQPKFPTSSPKYISTNNNKKQYSLNDD